MEACACRAGVWYANILNGQREGVMFRSSGGGLMRIKSISFILSMWCVLWVLFVPTIYAFTLNEDAIVQWLERTTRGGNGSAIFLSTFVLVEVVLVPIGLAFVLRSIWGISMPGLPSLTAT